MVIFSLITLSFGYGGYGGVYGGIGDVYGGGFGGIGGGYGNGGYGGGEGQILYNYRSRYFGSQYLSPLYGGYGGYCPLYGRYGRYGFGYKRRK